MRPVQPFTSRKPRILAGALFLLIACGEPSAPPTRGAVSPLTAQAREVPGFFTAFSWIGGKALKTPIETQPYDASQCPEIPGAPCLNDAVYRQQWNDVTDRAPVAAWAADHPGHLYIVGDAVHATVVFDGIYARDPALFAVDYCAFLREVRAVDPTSQFTPGLMEPWATDEWLDKLADALLAEYQRGQCGTHPISEWEFNFYGPWTAGLPGVKKYVDSKAAWAKSRPAPIAAPLVLSAWVLGWYGDDVAEDDPAYLERLREAKAFLFADEDVIHARYLFYEPWPTDNPEPHPLTDKTGQLNATGRVYAEVTGRIAGPKTVQENSSCAWIAETTGGPSPYAFQWFKNGEPVATEPGIAVARPDSAFALELLVTDAAGGHSKARMEVTVAADAPPCL